MTSAGKRIGLFGGAFDPVHTGHVHVADSFLHSHVIDELLILPTPDPPHKNLGASTSFEHRFEMLQLAFRQKERVEVSTIEKNLPSPSYTLQTIEQLQNENPQNIYFLCIGEDNLASFHRWHRYRDILDKVTLLVVSRPGSDARTQDPEILEKTIVVDHDEVEVSSTKIRSKGQPGKIITDIPDEVADYINKHNLYRHEA
ncbi:MAG: nicotinate (nicotinamide) nucleotide adenylyltransferase [Bacteroidetes bacterium]|jgi:nicotinate-nucleotide adenylyltransferase|nr:nicotinate (nicotinamide) nucleotide adenylyltransferase [Bacteroidota bacterium]